MATSYMYIFKVNTLSRLIIETTRTSHFEKIGGEPREGKNLIIFLLFFHTRVSNFSFFFKFAYLSRCTSKLRPCVSKVKINYIFCVIFTISLSVFESRTLNDRKQRFFFHKKESRNEKNTEKANLLLFFQT